MGAGPEVIECLALKLFAWLEIARLSGDHTGEADCAPDEGIASASPREFGGLLDKRLSLLDVAAESLIVGCLQENVHTKRLETGCDRRGESAREVRSTFHDVSAQPPEVAERGRESQQVVALPVEDVEEHGLLGTVDAEAVCLQNAFRLESICEFPMPAGAASKTRVRNFRLVSPFPQKATCVV